MRFLRLSETNGAARAARLIVTSPSRIHTGLLDESGYSGRIDGGFGFALAAPRVEFEVTVADRSRLCSAAAMLDSGRTRFSSSIPKHVGLGSHTAAAMATGTGGALLRRQEVDFLRIASERRRGGTSGVGVHIAANGGAVLDAGHLYPGEKSQFGPSSSVLAGPPALVDRWTFPRSWRVIHFRLTDERGLSGSEEASFFSDHCPIPRSESRIINSLVSSCLVPAMNAQALDLLHAFLDALQQVGLKVREWKVQPSEVVEFQTQWEWRRKQSRNILAPLGLSSVGPTLYLVTARPEREMATLRDLGVKRSRITVTTVPDRGTEWRWHGA